ncbi:MAG: gamma carbonic anhydrase family protein [Natronospirillum sp.]|uniref:gamma carbonic anhydrase family protein n=1 Tax=Natronospirillum sp. TaxID=2812955 RepID=UPI0025CD3DB7|nr:gamma carbonic anhydrase family protein [Natronospirillum sp.]MCH8552194.1 gamma carbonic anhydrase family protein [Natronospirillum sp.]
MSRISFRDKAPRTGERVMIDPLAFVLGDVELGDDVSVWPGAVIRGDMHAIRVGARTSVQDGAVLHITHASDYNPGGYPLVIGDDVTIGHQACLHGCTLGNQILVGIGARVLDGAVVEDQVVIGAGTLVPSGKTLESGFVYMGSPARQVRALSDKEKSFFRYTAANYVRLKDEYLEAGIHRRNSGR